jgi:predicted negative regulator of RcsB-dependent stress response
MVKDNYDYYKDLGVSRDADDKEIHKAYRNLAKKYHPDICKESDAEERFKKINRAYEIFTDEKEKISKFFQSADEYTNKGQYNAALYEYNEILGFKPNNIDALKGKSAALFELKRYDKAIAVYDKILLKYPNDSAILYLKGDALSLLGKYHEAVEVYNKSLKLDPNNIKIITNRDNALEHIELLNKSKPIESPPTQVAPNDFSTPSFPQNISKSDSSKKTIRNKTLNAIRVVSLGSIFLFIFLIFLVFIAVTSNGSYTPSTKSQFSPVIPSTPSDNSNILSLVTQENNVFPSSTPSEYNPSSPTAQLSPTPRTHIVNVAVDRQDTKLSPIITVTYQGGVDEDILIGLQITGSGIVPKMIGSISGNDILPLNSQITIPASEAPVTLHQKQKNKVHVVVIGYFGDGVEQSEYDNFV